MFVKAAVAVVGVLAVAGLALSLGESNRADEWKQWEFLVGEWVGEGTGKPGEATGGFTFQRELDGNVLVRKNKAEYPAQGGRPASSHEDLMIVYKDPAGKRTRAVYFDNESHVINYTAELSSDNKVLTFVSDGKRPSEPLLTDPLSWRAC